MYLGHTSAFNSSSVPSGFLAVLAKMRIFSSQYFFGQPTPGQSVYKSAQILQRCFAFLDFVAIFLFLLIFSISRYHGKEVRLEKALALPLWKTLDVPIMPLA